MFNFIETNSSEVIISVAFPELLWDFCQLWQLRFMNDRLAVVPQPFHFQNKFFNTVLRDVQSLGYYFITQLCPLKHPCIKVCDSDMTLRGMNTFWKTKYIKLKRDTNLLLNCFRWAVWDPVQPSWKCGVFVSAMQRHPTQRLEGAAVHWAQGRSGEGVGLPALIYPHPTPCYMLTGSTPSPLLFY